MILEDILVQAGVEYVSHRGDPAEISMACPFCAGQFDTMSERKVFGLNLENGKAHCYRCDWKSRSVSYTARRLCEAFSIEFSWRMRLSAGYAESTLVEPKAPVPEPIDLPVGYERFTGSRDRIEVKAVQYLQERGITPAMVRKYQIGYAAAGDFAWRIIIPVIGDDGQVYGFVGRDFSGSSEVKYLNSTDHVKILWGLNGIKGGTVILMEGIIDAIRSNVRLEERTDWVERAINAATLGSTITDTQIAQLRRFKQVVHFPDWDKAGVKGVLQRAPATHEAGIKTFVAIPKVLDGRDPDSMDATTYFKAVRGAKLWSLATKMRLRLLLAG